MKTISKRLGAAEFTRHSDNISDLLEGIYTITGNTSYALESLLGELMQEARLMERALLQAGFASDGEAMYQAMIEKEQESCL